MIDAITFPGNPEPEPVKVPRFTLRNEVGWLNLDGTGITIDKQHRYRGTLSQAQKMRAISAAATGMKIISL